jgi:thioredoxin reductase
VDERPIVRLAASDGQLQRVDFASGDSLRREVLFVHPPQRQVDMVRALRLETDAHGPLRVDDMTEETSTPGIYAAGDIITRAQAALLGAASGMRAAGADPIASSPRT